MPSLEIVLLSKSPDGGWKMLGRTQDAHIIRLVKLALISELRLAGDVVPETLHKAEKAGGRLLELQGQRGKGPQ